MYLFILESIGTSELLLIGIIALIIFGPRKLPQLARTIGKTMADFRRTTHEFKSNWEKEVSFEEEKSQIKNLLADSETENNSISRANLPEISETSTIPTASAISPEIKEISASEIKEKMNLEEDVVKEKQIEPDESDKRNWL